MGEPIIKLLRGQTCESVIINQLAYYKLGSICQAKNRFFLVVFKQKWLTYKYLRTKKKASVFYHIWGRLTLEKRQSDVLSRTQAKALEAQIRSKSFASSNGAWRGSQNLLGLKRPTTQADYWLMPKGRTCLQVRYKREHPHQGCR